MSVSIEGTLVTLNPDTGVWENKTLLDLQFAVENFTGNLYLHSYRNWFDLVPESRSLVTFLLRLKPTWYDNDFSVDETTKQWVDYQINYWYRAVMVLDLQTLLDFDWTQVFEDDHYNREGESYWDYFDYFRGMSLHPMLKLAEQQGNNNVKLLWWFE